MSVFSTFDRASGQFLLTVRNPDGTLLRPDVPARPVPFDADIGPDSNGGPQLIYSRCDEEEPLFGIQPRRGT